MPFLLCNELPPHSQGPLSTMSKHFGKKMPQVVEEGSCDHQMGKRPPEQQQTSSAENPVMSLFSWVFIVFHTFSHSMPLQIPSTMLTGSIFL